MSKRYMVKARTVWDHPVRWEERTKTAAVERARNLADSDDFRDITVIEEEKS